MLRNACLGMALMALSSTGMAAGSNDQKDFSIGLGLGVPYGGVVGVNVAHAVTDQLELSGAVGAGLGETGWSAGGRFFFTPSSSGDSGFRASLLYGTNAYLEVMECESNGFSSSCENEFSSYEGLNLGLGWGHRAGESGWNFDLIVILTSDVYDEVDRLEDEGAELEGESTGRVKLSFGYQWAL